MVIINEKKNKKDYNLKDIPEFDSKREKQKYLLNLRKEVMLLNIKSINIQVKDIKMMKYSSNPRLIGLFCLKKSLLNILSDEEYITINKTSSLNKARIYEIINSDFLVIENVFDKLSDEEINKICITTMNEIDGLKKMKAEFNYYKECRIKLLEYKLERVKEYLINRNTKQIKVK